MRTPKNAMRRAALGLAGSALLLSGCIETAKPAPEIVSITPSSVSAAEDTPAVIAGNHFFVKAKSDIAGNGKPTVMADFRVRFSNAGNERVVSATFVDTETLEVTIPAALNSGSYDVTVVTPDGLEGTLGGGLTVIGVPVRIAIEDAAGGVGLPVGSLDLTTDDLLQLYAVSRDATGRFVADEPVTWSVVGNTVGIIEIGPASESTLELTSLGQAVVFADHPVLGTGTTGAIDVTAGAVARVVIALSAHGQEVSSQSLPIGTVLSLFANGYDADNNYVSEVDATWSVTNGIGNLSPSGPAAQVSLTPTKAGAGQVLADLGTGVSDATGNITVIAGIATGIAIVDAPDGHGQVITTLALTADDTRTFYAVGVDEAGNFKSNQAVDWSWAGDHDSLGGLGAASQTSSVVFAAGTKGVGVLVAASAGLDDGTTGHITVDPGVLAGVQILDGGDDPIPSQNLPSGSTLALHAVGIDADGNPIGPETVTWRVQPTTIGFLSDTSGPTTTLTAALVGSGRVLVDLDGFGGDTDAQTGDLTVGHGAPVSVSIEDGSGNAYTSITILESTSRVLYAVERDAAGNVVPSDCGNVAWAADFTTGHLTSPGCTTVFNVDAGAASGHVTANDPDFGPTPDRSVPVNVVANTATRLYVSSAPTICANATAQTISTAQSVTLYAVGCDNSDVFVAQLNATWTLDSAVPSGVGLLSQAQGPSVAFEPRVPGTVRVKGSYSALTAFTGTITVTLGPVVRVAVETAADGSGSEVGTVNVPAGNLDSIWYAVGRDSKNNFVAPQPVSWSFVGDTIGVLTPTNGNTSVTFAPQWVGSARVRADHADQSIVDDETGLITVIAGPVSALSLEFAADGHGGVIGDFMLNADQTLRLWAVGRDEFGNFSGLVPVSWTVDGQIGTLDEGPATSTRFDATTVGEGRISAANAGNTMTAATDRITVTPGEAVRVVIEYGQGEPLDEVGEVALGIGQALLLHAVGRDADGNAATDASVEWSSLTDAFGIEPSSGPSTKINGERIGSGVLTATPDNGALAADSTGTITVSATTCGNGIIEGSEVCDGNALNGETCWSQGYLRGGVEPDLRCDGHCAAFVTTGCGSAINSTTNIQRALNETYTTAGHETISIHAGSYTFGTSLVLDECPGTACAQEREGVTLRPLFGVVALTSPSCMLATQVLMLINSPNNEIRGLRFSSCSGAIVASNGAPNTVISHNAFVPQPMAEEKDLVWVQGSDNRIEANQFNVLSTSTAAAAIRVGPDPNDGSGKKPTGNQIAMNVIAGYMRRGIYAYSIMNTRPTMIDHNSVWAQLANITTTAEGMRLQAIGALCYRNNIIIGAGVGMNSTTGLVLDDVTPTVCLVDGAQPSQNGTNVNLGSSPLCAGTTCSMLCGGTMITKSFCDTSISPNWSKPSLCLMPASNGLINIGRATGWDMWDDSTTNLYSGPGPDVGAREHGVSRNFAGDISDCTGL